MTSVQELIEQERVRANYLYSNDSNYGMGSLSPRQDRKRRGVKLVCEGCGVEYRGEMAQATTRRDFRCPTTGEYSKRVEVPLQ